jgi:hypothetical protein
MLTNIEVKEIAEILKDAIKPPIHPEVFYAFDSLIMEFGIYFEEKNIPGFSFKAFSAHIKTLE